MNIQTLNAAIAAGIKTVGELGLRQDEFKKERK